MVNSPSCQRRAKRREQDFTGKRKMTFPEHICFMLGTVKESSQNAPERFFPKAGKGHIPMSRQAFSAARQKIQWEAPEKLFQTGISGSYRGQWERRHGYRLTAADGSLIRLPSDPELTAYYGGLGHEAAPLLYDLENGITADVRRRSGIRKR